MRPLVNHLHVRREVGKSFVEVVHLCQNADGCQDHENISRRMAELVVASKGEL